MGETVPVHGRYRDTQSVSMRTANDSVETSLQEEVDGRIRVSQKHDRTIERFDTQFGTEDPGDRLESYIKATEHVGTIVEYR